MTAPPLESSRINSFSRACVHGKERAIARAWSALVRNGVPLIEAIPGNRDDVLVTFVWRPAHAGRAASVFTTAAESTREGAAMRLIPRAGVWYRSLQLSRSVRACYRFSPRPFPGWDADDRELGRYMQSLRPDPLNARRFVLPKSPDDPDTLDTLSVIELPGAAAQRWLRTPPSPTYHEEHHRLSSRFLPGERSVWVNLPAEFDPSRRRYHLLVVFDGLLCRQAIPVPTIVENLVRARRIGPTVVALVGNGPHARFPELGGNPRFVEFLGRELVPWLVRKYRLSVDARKVVLAGSSLGGLTAAYAALRYPRLFGNVLAQSGSFPWPCADARGRRTSLMDLYARSPKLPLRFYLDTGKLETTAIPEWGGVSQLAGVRHMRDVLVAKGYPVTYAEFDGGHDYVCWASTFADGLLSLLGRLV